MSFHNVRDKTGRFAPKPKRGRPLGSKAKSKAKPVEAKHILNVFVLDDTASMSNKVDATIEGFNQVLADAKKSSSELGVVNYEAFSKFGVAGNATWKVGDVKPLSSRQGAGWPYKIEDVIYNPSQGGTALWDAIIVLTGRTEEYLRTLPVGTKVIFTIFTDGENNQLNELLPTAKRLVEIKQSEGWVINFVGAGEEQFIRKMSQSVGIFASNTLSYVNNSVGTRNAMMNFSNARTNYTKAVADGVESNVGFFSQN